MSDVEALVNNEYDLGVVMHVEQLHGGLVNRSFVVQTETAQGLCRYLVREYNEAIAEAEIRFEHAFLMHLAERGFAISAGVLPDRRGCSFMALKGKGHGECSEDYVAVFEYCKGEAKYTWMQNRCTEKEYRSAARALADLHRAAADFVTNGLNRAQPPIMEFLAGLRPTLLKYAESVDSGSFSRFYRSQLPSICSVLDRGVAVEPMLEGLPVLPLHCDYHPGNMTFLDEEICGLFDFDWAKIDYRVFDIAVALVYFFSSCQGDDKGRMRLAEAGSFVQAYQEQAARAESPGAMGERELLVVPRMMANANLYLLVWALDCYYVEHRDEREYLAYLKNYVSIMEDIEQRQSAIQAIMLGSVLERTRPE